MTVFEFHFNPKLKPYLIFDSFCYEPENIYEKRMGSLYMVGILKNVLPKNLQFLERLSKSIKERYYRATIFTPEKSFRESLKEANEFLEQIAKRGDVSWLGNLSFAVLSLKNFKLNFTKVGDIKIFLFRGEKIIDIDKKLRFQDIEPYPLKIFGNIVSGKLAENDLILVLTKEVFDFFQQENLLNEIARQGLFSEEEFKRILDGKREALSKISGLCLVIFLTKEIGYPVKSWVSKKETILPQISKEFSLKEVFSPSLKFFLDFSQKIRLRLVDFSKPVKLLKFPRVEVPKLGIEVFKTKIKSFTLNKKLILVLTLIIILGLGFIFARIEEKQKIRIYQNNLKEIEEKLNLAESFLILKETNPQAIQKANSLLKESWEKISPISKEAANLPKYFSNRVFSLKDEILEKLCKLNKLEKIEEPELFFEFKIEKFVPQKMVSFENEIYFFSPYSKNLFKLDKEGKDSLSSVDNKFNLAATLEDSILFFTKPNQLIILRGDKFFSFSLQEPYPDFNFDDFSSFKGNLYFFDKKSGQIIKYPYYGNFEWGKSEFWLKKATHGESMVVNGSVWILDKNSISRYYAGNLQAKIELDIFPYPKDCSKIFTSPSLSYLYILEPIQKRIVILDKAGQIIKQFQSEKFDNLLDFSVSKDGKTIWLLNGLKVYRIELIP